METNSYPEQFPEQQVFNYVVVSCCYIKLHGLNPQSFKNLLIIIWLSIRLTYREKVLENLVLLAGVFLIQNIKLAFDGKRYG